MLALPARFMPEEALGKADEKAGKRAARPAVNER